MMSSNSNANTNFMVRLIPFIIANLHGPNILQISMKETKGTRTSTITVQTPKRIKKVRKVRTQNRSSGGGNPTNRRGADGNERDNSEERENPRTSNPTNQSSSNPSPPTSTDGNNRIGAQPSTSMSHSPCTHSVRRLSNSIAIVSRNPGNVNMENPTNPGTSQPQRISQVAKPSRHSVDTPRRKIMLISPQPLPSRMVGKQPRRKHTISDEVGYQPRNNHRHEWQAKRQRQFECYQMGININDVYPDSD